MPKTSLSISKAKWPPSNRIKHRPIFVDSDIDHNYPSCQLYYHSEIIIHPKQSMISRIRNYVFQRLVGSHICNFSSMWSPLLPMVKDCYDGSHFHLATKVDLATVLETIDGLEKPEQSEPPKTIWFHLQPSNFHLLQPLIEQRGFKIHQGLDSKISVYKWLPNRPDLVAPYTMFQISCGAILIHQSKILLVQEKSGERKGAFGIPGGRASKSDTIADCCVRELEEETGVKAKFKGIFFMRQLVGKNFIHDLYFGCLVEPESDPLDIKLCPHELIGYKWVPLEDYENFLSDKAYGTQLQLARYVSKKLKKGQLHCQITSNSTAYVRPRNPQPLVMIQHTIE